MLSEEEKQVVHYLRESPSDSLKRDAADIIEELDGVIDSLISCADDFLKEPGIKDEE